MPQLGKLIVLAGLALMVLGSLVWGLGRLGFRGLPGDVRYDSERVHVYFPIVSCLLLSAVLTLGMWLWHWLSQK